ncbi:hypothetical protein F5B19DRAFT_123936 [Rostrohypoxylon terebratum]|nr:hypothetical protein F5B19DRAFT_123936 [Rostrohypoxylon terebratum]
MPLKPAVSALARQTMRVAFQELETTITPADSRDFSRSTLEHVRKFALDIENQLAARQCLRNMRRLKPLFDGLEHYSKVADILCNGTPYLPWIWAPITLILQVASEYIDAFDQIIEGYSRISESLKRFEVLDNTFGDKADFQQTLAIYYADILQFHKHAYKFVRRSGWKLLFLTSWGRFQRCFNDILEDMKRHEELIDKEAQARHVFDMRRLQSDISAWKKESQEKTNQLEEEEAAKHYQSILSWLKADESDQLTIFDSISAEASRYPGTCDWIWKHKKIPSFLNNNPETQILWLQGGPGSGKSALSTQLINFMRNDKKFVISHFCTRLYPSTITYDQVLRSILLQLLRKDGDFVAHVYEQYVLKKKTPRMQLLEGLLLDLLTRVSQAPCKNEYVWIFIDGLNECDEQTQATVATFVNRVTSTTPSSAQIIHKVLISSRVSPTVYSRLRKKQVLSLAEEKVSMGLAIRNYTSQRLQSLQEKFNQLHLDPKEIESIRDEITKKSDGMFLYARLVLNFLSNKIFYKGSEVKSSVNELPEELSDFYRKILVQILVRLDNQSISRVKSILSWIAFAKRPLKRIEFLSAISFSSGDPHITHLVPMYVLDICGTLVEERQDTTLAFIHSSVKEFLLSPSSNLAIDERGAIAEHSLATIACLLSGVDVFVNPCQDDTKYLRVAKGLHGLHVYSTEYWIEYLLSQVTLAPCQITSIIFNLANQLAEKLFLLRNPAVDMQDPVNLAVQDTRLVSLQNNLLRKEVEWILWTRSLQGLESGLQINKHPDNLAHSTEVLPRDGMSAMLTSYEDSVKFLLAQNDYPGVSAEELESFKSQFRESAYTCRLTSCPRATLGFQSEALRSEHEISHLPRLRCSFPGCQNPPFMSKQALENHTRKYHVSQPIRKSIRARDSHLHISEDSDAVNIDPKISFNHYNFISSDLKLKALR